MTSLPTLIARLSEGEGRDRRLDCAIHALLEPGWLGDKIDWLGFEYHDSFDPWQPKYCESLDACLALARKVLPGWVWSISTAFNGGGNATGLLYDEARHIERHSYGQHKSSLTRAFLIALLRAHQQKETGND